NDIKDAKGWTYFQDNYDDKFAIRFNNKIFIGLSPIIPLTNYYHYITENINWLNETLDTLKLSDEIYFFSPVQFDVKVDNWKTLLTNLSGKNLKLMINGNATKTELRNLHGYSILDVQSSQHTNKKIFDFVLIEISDDSVKIFDNTKKIITAFDKTIDIPKEKIDIDKLQAINSDILLSINLNSTMLKSCSYWNNKIYTFDYSGLISCIDTTGKVKWEFDANGNIIGKPIIADMMIATATFQGDLISLSAISGEQFQSIGFEDYITTDLLAINYNGDKELMIPKLSQSTTAVVFGTSSGKVYCYDLETLQEYWSNNYCKEMISSNLLYVDNKIFYTSRDGFLYCIDARNGITIWRWKEKANTDLSYSQLLSDGKKVFVISQEGILYAVNLLLGKLDWKINNQFFQNFGLSENKKMIFAESQNNEFMIISADKGKIERKIKTDINFLNSFSTPVEIDNKIFWSGNGFINYFDSKFNSVKNLYLGTAPIHPVEKISSNKYLTSNIDGTIVIFKTR
ncbi:MAG: PQQ-binding-like beta-propeller repeat protein, partial [Melioribacter sp.]|nr:PQQ-binding-like beta-propeller repeat protein [Melioribacter sp.]